MEEDPQRYESQRPRCKRGRNRGVLRKEIGIPYAFHDSAERSVSQGEIVALFPIAYSAPVVMPYPSTRIFSTVTPVLFLFLFGTALACAQSTPHGKASALFDAMNITEGDWAADVGSGDGDYTFKMAREVGDSGRVFAVDIDEDDLGELNGEIEDRGVDNITTVYSVPDNPMLPSRSLDAALVRNAYHEFTAHESMLRHLREALKPGGRLVMEESVSSDMVGKSRDEQTDDHDLGITYAREELQAAGFSIEKEDPSFVEADGHHHWLIIATRPAP